MGSSGRPGGRCPRARRLLQGRGHGLRLRALRAAQLRLAGRLRAAARRPLAAAPELDVYVSVLLHRSGTSGRERATALGGGVAWADVDGDWTPERQAALDALEVDAWHVESGARGGRHVYVPLGEDVDPDRLEQINRRLALALDADDGWSRTKVLRLPGTSNHKPRPFGATSAAVRWLW